MRPLATRLALLTLALLADRQAAVASDGFVGSMSVLGAPNRELLEGAELLERGDMTRGVELTQIGLRSRGRRVSREMAQRARSRS